ncbi:unnamed protein product [Lactuca virosa]|uniref:FAS1 domain-containing protein n=1 Tax=Lactuca virosa TaxID=75947 RepID=A0AAU9N398_9ASTR|nr:unnamed protein product [Lactuca virosa]
MAVKQTVILAAASLLIIFRLTSALPTETITNAADTLSNSGYVAMSLTLNLVSDVLLSYRNSATIFTPPDSAFADYGQPSLATLQFHFSPLAFSLSKHPFPPIRHQNPHHVLRHLPNSHYISLLRSDPPVQSVRLDHCTASFGGYSNFSFHDGANLLISRGYSVMASFLNLQLLGFLGQATLTIFAPIDEVMVDYSGRFPDYPSLFLRHVLPCKISWRDLISVDDGTSLDTYLDGFKITIHRSGGTFKVNEASITFPDMYYGDSFVVHGIREVLALPKPAEESGDGDGFDDIPIGTVLVATVPDRSEF